MVVTLKEDMVHVRKVDAYVIQITTFINFELSSFINLKLNKKIVMEKLVPCNMIRLHLLDYCLPPNEMKARHSFALQEKWDFATMINF
jgi:hypothetical protein